MDVRESGVTGYGYMWWVTEVVDESGYLAYGLGGQVIHVLPDRGLVLAVATEFDDRDPARMAKEFGSESAVSLIENAVLPSLDD